MSGISARDEFLDNVRRALGRGPGPPVVADGGPSAFAEDVEAVDARARSAREIADADADGLMSELQSSADQAGWHVTRVASVLEAGAYVEGLARRHEVRSLMRSAHGVLDGLDLETRLGDSGVEVAVMAVDEAADEARRDDQRRDLRRRVVDADIGVTGVDYAIAETGTCVLLPRKGLSRLVSLVPPVYVAVVERGQVLPSLDELFALRREDFMDGALGSYMSLITGPSRSADIESTLVTGMHGPGEVHMVLVG